MDDSPEETLNSDCVDNQRGAARYLQQPGMYVDCLGRRFEVYRTQPDEEGSPFEIAVFREEGFWGVQTARTDFLAEVIMWPDGELKPRFLYEEE
jgi:hypothetical protein